MRWVAGLLATLVLAGCSAKVGGEADRDRAASANVGAVDLRVPLELCPVLNTVPSGTPNPPPATASVLPDADGNRYTLDEPFLTVERIEAGSVDQSDTNWIIKLTLTEPNGKVFADWTATHVGEQVAVVAKDEVIFAPEIAQPIPGNEIQIAGSYTREEAEDFLNDITGR